jgi:hypothetical protein
MKTRTIELKMMAKPLLQEARNSKAIPKRRQQAVKKITTEQVISHEA